MVSFKNIGVYLCRPLIGSFIWRVFIKWGIFNVSFDYQCTSMCSCVIIVKPCHSISNLVKTTGSQWQLINLWQRNYQELYKSYHNEYWPGPGQQTMSVKLTVWRIYASLFFCAKTFNFLCRVLLKSSYSHINSVWPVFLKLCLQLGRKCVYSHNQTHQSTSDLVYKGRCNHW